MVKTIFVDQLAGANAKNSWNTIRIKRGLPCIGAIWAQEMFEVQYRRKHPLAAILRLKRFQRESELMGHEVEVQAAVRFYDRKEYNYRFREARVVSGYTFFSGWSPMRVRKEMLSRRAVALRWVIQNQWLISQFMDLAEAEPS